MLDVRYALYRTLEEAQEAHARVAAGSHPESRRILALAQRAFGDLRGLLIGLPTELLDRAPREGEWPLRETLRHMLTVERRYAVQTRYAVDRIDAEPVRIPEDRQPTVAATAVDGEIDTILARIGEARAETNRWLGDLAPETMTRPTLWVGYDVDVRFRLHRFAPHLVEHTVQCEKSLAPTWFDPAEHTGIITLMMVLYAVHDALVKPMPGNPMAPSLAESWTVSKDGLSYEFVLRKGVVFHNGDPFTAEDVKFSFERYKGAAAKLLKDKVAAVEIVDPFRVDRKSTRLNSSH